MAYLQTSVLISSRCHCIGKGKQTHCANVILWFLRHRCCHLVVWRSCSGICVCVADGDILTSALLRAGQTEDEKLG